MKTAPAKFKNNFIRIFAIFSAFMIFLLLVMGIGKSASAQEEDDALWQTGLNLSQSGTATNPTFLKDANNTTHLFWEDNFSGFVYTTGNGDEWTTPTSIIVPFTDPPFLGASDPGFKSLLTPNLVADNGERVHAFWVDTDNILYYSRSLVTDISLGQNGWTFPQILKSKVLEPTSFINSTDTIHLAYVSLENTPDTPAGIYYQQSIDGGVIWSEAQLIYASAYLRAVPSSQIHLTMSGSGETVQITWDDPLLETIFYMRSANDGIDWEPAVAIDQRELTDSLDVPGPAHINLLVQENNSHLVWKTGDPDTGCVLNHQFSANAGSSWLSPEAIPTQTTEDCPTNIWLLDGLDGSVWMLTEYQGGAFLQVWDGEIWSEPVLQTSLSSFVNPQTFRGLAFGCWEPSIKNEGHLIVFGCGNGAVNDVWVRERPLGEIESWFVEPESDWSKPDPYVTTKSPLNSPIIVADDGGLFHSFWVDVNLESEIQKNALYYSYWDKNEWSRTATLFTLGNVRQVEATYYDSGRLSVIWHDDTNELFYSHVAADRALFPADWSIPSLLPISQPGIGEFDLFIDEGNKIHLAYAVSVNEDRGIYVTTSEDSGVNWSEPINVFNAEDAGWEKVDLPRLAVSGGESYYFVWSRIAVADSQSESLFYAYSNDGGQNWSEPEMIIDGPVSWSDIVAINGERAIRVWQEEDEESYRIWHQVSFDNGQTWNNAQLIPGFEAINGLPDTVVDATGQFHLVQFQQDDDQMIQRWQWDEEGLIISEEFNLPAADVTVFDLDTAIDLSGHLGVVYAGQTTVQEEIITLLQFTNRQLDLPEQVATPMPTLVPTNTPVPEVASPEPEVEATSTPELPLTFEEANSSPLGEVSMPLGIAIGVVPVALVIFMVFGIRWLKERRK
ncbi:MAG: exo-alpha-sialidase [Chloroflexi bacterium]|nr:MAG: exo-alpha-sialidase [Chloroflexota bacterium]